MTEKINIEHLPLEAALEAVIGWERKILLHNLDTTYGSARVPDATLRSGQRFTDIVEILTQTQDRVRVLDLGAGDDCALWTGGHSNSSIKKSGSIKPIKEIENKREKLYVVGHSGSDRLGEWCIENGTDEFHSGHFLDLLNLLKSRGDKFDLIVSHYAIYQSIASIQVITGVDGLLSDQGYAFLDTVGKGSGSSKVLFYPISEEPVGKLDRTDLSRRLSFRDVQFGGLHWTVHSESENVAWKKGDLKPDYIPELKRVGQLADSYFGSPYRAIYTVAGTF